MKVTIDIEISDQSCADIMCTALEGGIGYWCVSDRISRVENGVSDYVAFDAYDAEDPDTKFGHVNYDTIRAGIQRILNGTVKIRSDLREQVLTVVDEERCDIDSEAADCIVQAGLFNELVYG